LHGEVEAQLRDWRCCAKETVKVRGGGDLRDEELAQCRHARQKRGEVRGVVGVQFLQCRGIQKL
jgi:hypothetical protein